MKLNEQIAQLRKEQKMSQEELAAAMDVSRQAISKWENGQCNPDTENLIRLAEIFEVDVNLLIREDAVPAPVQYENKKGIPAAVVWVLGIALALAIAAASVFACLWLQEIAPSDAVETEPLHLQMYSGLTRDEISLTQVEQEYLIGYISQFNFTEALKSDGKNENGETLYGGRNYLVEYTQDGVDYSWRFMEHGFSCTMTSGDGRTQCYYAADWELLYKLDFYVYRT